LVCVCLGNVESFIARIHHPTQTKGPLPPFASGWKKMNTMDFNGYKAVISYDPEINMFRGEFVGLNGGADFYASSVDDLRKEGELSLKTFLDMCAEDGVEPRKQFSGKFNLRVPPTLHERLATQASARGKSINAWIVEILSDSDAHVH